MFTLVRFITRIAIRKIGQATQGHWIQMSVRPLKMKPFAGSADNIVSCTGSSLDGGELYRPSGQCTSQADFKVKNRMVGEPVDLKNILNFF